MRSTQYTFDQPRSRYDPEQTIVAKKKIADAQALMDKIVVLRDDAKTSKEFEKLLQRHSAAKEARNWWTEILEEE